MHKNISKILTLGILLAFSVATVAFADVPDPSGRPRTRPRPMAPAAPCYSIQNETRDAAYGEGQVAIILKYRAPAKAQIDYFVKNTQGQTLTQDTQIAEGNEGTILVVLNKPAAGESYSIRFESACYATEAETPFGLKQTDEPQLSGTWKCTYTLACDANGVVDIERSDVSVS